MVVISQHPRRIGQRSIDPAMYAWRHLIENVFRPLKEFKRIATRSDKTDDSDRAMILAAAAATVIHSRDEPTDSRAVPG